MEHLKQVDPGSWWAIQAATQGKGAKPATVSSGKVPANISVMDIDTDEAEELGVVGAECDQTNSDSASEGTDSETTAESSDLSSEEWSGSSESDTE